jgi:hypothetical protein
MKHYFEVQLTYIDASGEEVNATCLTKAESIVKATPAVVRRMQVQSGDIIRACAELMDAAIAGDKKAEWWMVIGPADEDINCRVQAYTPGEAKAIVAKNLGWGPEKEVLLNAFEMKYTKVIL